MNWVNLASKVLCWECCALQVYQIWPHFVGSKPEGGEGLVGLEENFFWKFRQHGKLWMSVHDLCVCCTHGAQTVVKEMRRHSIPSAIFHRLSPRLKRKKLNADDACSKSDRSDVVGATAARLRRRGKVALSRKLLLFWRNPITAVWRVEHHFLVAFEAGSTRYVSC